MSLKQCPTRYSSDIKEIITLVNSTVDYIHWILLCKLGNAGRG